eukprot:CAMPEP_0176182500 /NCGR_PEP_ID=MMETSP0120_2-20121206/93508_1 /TAXON_ID=160619 /ORGANISM="Kryptoperidinium foliaceum, Strain CCMP 1326" /LENGTH=88 /DNA_ID=CAMNT_0017520749 /DNA_START=240 /DNA_END=506 /DNA_ORIENTATION=+
MLMNHALRQSARMSSRRFLSSTDVYAKKKAQSSVSQNWLQDPSTYPLMACMAGAGFLVVGVVVSGLVYNPDVQISPKRRGAVMRHWGF